MKTVRANVSIDWTLRENVRANLRVLVRRRSQPHAYLNLRVAERISHAWTRSRRRSCGIIRAAWDEGSVKVMDIDLLRKTPTYPFVEAAHYIGVPVSTLRSWCVGQDYTYRDAKRHFCALIRMDGKRSEGLSFLNLVEAHVLAAIRRVHGVPMPRVRAALSFVTERMGVERPLADIAFETDGLNLFVAELDPVVEVSREGQLKIASMIHAHLARIERDPSGVPIKLYPFTLQNAPADAPNPVEVDPRIAFGRPVLRGRGVPTSVLADRFKAGDTLRELAADYDVSSETVEEAIRCEFDRRQAA